MYCIREATCLSKKVNRNNFYRQTNEQTFPPEVWTNQEHELPRAVALLQAMYDNWASAIEGYRDKAIQSWDVHRCPAMMPGTAKPIYYRALLLPNIENDLKEGDTGEVNREKPYAKQW